VQQVASRQYDAALLDHIGALCECQRRVRILLNQQHSNASFRQGRDSLENIRGNKRSQTRGGGLMAWPEIRVDNCIGARAVSFSGSPALPAKLLQFATNTVKMRAEADGCSSSSAENPD
jgi:hypothetical protein